MIHTELDSSQKSYPLSTMGNFQTDIWEVQKLVRARRACPNWLALYQMIISHPKLVCLHVSDKQMTWESVYYGYNFGLLAARALHVIFSQMPCSIAATPW